MFVCIENNVVTTILNYEPNVPDSVEVVKITSQEYEAINNRTHFFDVETKSVKPMPKVELDKQAAEKQNIQHIEFLNRTDWQVLRHLRQKALGIATSLTDEEYLALEQERQNAANSIINV